MQLTNGHILKLVFPELTVNGSKVIAIKDGNELRQLTGYVLTSWLKEPYNNGIDNGCDGVRIEIREGKDN